MSTTAELLNLGKEFEFEGSTYRLKEMTLMEEGLFSTWLEGQAYKCVERCRDVMSPEAYDSALASIPRDSAAGLFAWGGKLSIQALGSPSGLKQYLKLCLVGVSEDADPITEEFVDRLFAHQQRQIVSLIAAAEGGDPKAVAVLQSLVDQGRQLFKFSLPSVTNRFASRSKKRRRSRGGKSRNSTSEPVTATAE